MKRNCAAIVVKNILFCPLCFFFRISSPIVETEIIATTAAMLYSVFISLQLGARFVKGDENKGRTNNSMLS